MDNVTLFDWLYSPVESEEPFLLTLRKNLNFFFEDSFYVSLETFNRIISDYKSISNPDFYLSVNVYNDLIDISFVLKEVQ